MIVIDNVMTADEGKCFRRIVDGTIYDSPICLGKSWVINGEILTEPHVDVPEDFEEIDIPVEEPTEEQVEEITDETESVIETIKDDSEQTEDTYEFSSDEMTFED